MTSVRLHGILAREYGNSFVLDIRNPRNVLHAIDCNRAGFIRRIISLQKEGCGYDIIINKKRISVGEEMEGFLRPETIDLVPVIAGGSGIEAWLIEKVVTAILFATITYALSPKPDIDALEVEASPTKQSLVFSNRANIASQGAPVPIGYGRLKVGTQVIQATVKSYPQSSNPEYILSDGNLTTDAAMASSRRAAPNPFGEPEDGGGAGGDLS